MLPVNPTLSATLEKGQRNPQYRVEVLELPTNFLEFHACKTI